MKPKSYRSFLRLGLAFSTLVVTVSSAHAQTSRSWAGAEGLFVEAANWTPEGAPEVGDDVTIASGVATASANLARGGATVLEGTGVLAVNARFLNASGAPAAVTVSGGELRHEGQFFIVALNQPGSLIQTGGVVDSTVTEAFYLSDGGGSSGLYHLQGGRLEVELAGNSALDRQVHLGRQGLGDRMLVEGGEARFHTDVENRRFYLSRNASLEIEAGRVEAEGFRFFLVGRDGGSFAASTLTMNGGELDLFGFPGNGAFIVGAGNDGMLRMNGGSLRVAEAPLWLGDGGGRSGTVLHEGGEVRLEGGRVVLGRAANGNGLYVLSGGLLEAAGIERPAGAASGHFVMTGGELRLAGDQRTVVDEPWFFTTASVSATYDAEADLTTFTAEPLAGVEKTHRYFRFSATRLRDGFITAVQLSELEFLRGGERVTTEGLTASSPDGDSPEGEGPERLVDGDPTTKWLDGTNQPLIVDFGESVTVDSYRLTTGNDAPGRDPLRWTLEGSDDGENWVVLDRIVEDFPMPSGRRLSTVDLPLPSEPAAEPPPPAELVWTGATSAEWNTSALNWSADGGPLAWNNGNPGIARFTTAGPKEIAVPGPVSVTGLSFEAAGYVLSGEGPLTLGSRSVVVNSADARVALPVNGSSGLRKEGGAGLELAAPLAPGGAVTVASGRLRFASGSSMEAAANVLLADEEGSRAVLEIDSEGLFNFSGSVRVGAGENSGAVIRQRAGEVVAGGPGIEYIELGGGIGATSGSWGGYELSGGLLRTNPGTSGIRVGNEGLGSFVQTGGTLECTRWFAIGGFGGDNAEGVASFLGGEATIGAGYRFLLCDRADVAATLNVGTQAGGGATVTTLNGTGLPVGANGNGKSATVNLNSGSLVLGGPLYKAGGAIPGRVHLNGGTIVAGADGISLMESSLTAVPIYNGGVTFDTAGRNARVNSALLNPMGRGVYPESGAFAVAAGGEGYLGAPLVRVTSSGFGTDLTAIAEIEDGAVARVLLTSPGEGHDVGDTLSFEFVGGGATVPAPTLAVTLGAADLQENDSGSLRKIGEGRLVLDGNVNHLGDTLIEQGILEMNGFVDETRIFVSPGATLTGNLDSFGPVTVEGTLAPGSAVGLARGSGELVMAAGSSLEIDLADWDLDAGVGHDSAFFNELRIQASAAEPMTVRLQSESLQGFAETAREFVLVNASTGVQGLQADNWRVEAPGFPGFGSWDLAVNADRLVLRYTPGEAPEGSYDSWVAGYAGLANAAPLADPDGDGIPNLLEFVLNGNPGQASKDILPSATPTPEGGMEFRFVRRVESAATVSQVFQYGDDLSGWTDLPIPAATAGAVRIEANTPSVGLETVIVTLTAEQVEDGRIFGRLAVSID